jgi:hypothetical protein
VAVLRGGPGYFKVQQDRAIALVDDAVRAEDIDIEEARREAEEARAALERADAGDEEIDRWHMEQRLRTPRTRSRSRPLTPTMSATSRPGSTRAPKRSSRRLGPRRGRTTRKRSPNRRARLPGARLGAEAAGLSFSATGCSAGRTLPPARGGGRGSRRRPLTRFLDTNTFYRGRPGRRRAAPASTLPAPDFRGEWLGTLPSPLAFARAARDEVSAQKLAANVLAPQIEAGRRPAPPDRPQRAVRRREGAATSSARLASCRRLPLALQLPFGDARPCCRAGEAPVAAIGIDFYATSLDARTGGISQGGPRRRPRRAELGAREPGRDRRASPRAAGREPAGSPHAERRPPVRAEPIARQKLALPRARAPRSRRPHERPLPHREIGSLGKPSWRVKAFAGRPLEQSDVERGRRVGTQARVEGHEELVERLRGQALEARR